MNAYESGKYIIGFGEEGDPRGDWYAYLDFEVKDRKVYYQVVVNSESGAFIETTEEGCSNWKDVRDLASFYECCATEQLEPGDDFTPEERKDNQATYDRWVTDLAAALGIEDLKEALK